VSPDLSTSPFALAAMALVLLGGVLALAGIVSLLRAKPLQFTARMLAGLVLLSLGALAGAIAVGTHGYRALTREDVAARLMVQPAGPQRFEATVRFADGREAKFELAGDQVYVDAHIIKWKPIANALGLHTAYELDRIAGRYQAIEQERAALRTVHSLRRDRPVDLPGLRQRYAVLGTLFDAEYGSATFAPVTRTAIMEVRVSSTGLLIREAAPASH
jgi:hypothetical protein